MIDLGLRKADMERFKALLVTHHRISVHVQLLKLDHTYVRDVTPKLLGGQVNIDITSDTTRSLDMELLDPEHDLHLDQDSAQDGSLYYNRMVKVIYGVISPDGDDQFYVPIFTGPISKVERDGAVISLTCSGKEKLVQASIWRGRTFKRKRRKTWVITRILRDIGGERHLNIPDLKPTLPKDLSANKKHTVWGLSKSLGGSLDHRQLFYNGRGVAVLRRPPSKVVYTFREKGALLSYPQASYDAEGVINAVEVIGGKPKKAKHNISYKLVAPRNHPLSPWNMGRNGVPRYLPVSIQDDSIKTKKAARARAKKRLKDALVEQVDVAFDSLPVPFLEEGDLCSVHSSVFSGVFKLRQMTIPLTADGVSSIGYLRRVSPNRRQLHIRHTQKHKKRRRRGRG